MTGAGTPAGCPGRPQLSAVGEAALVEARAHGGLPPAPNDPTVIGPFRVDYRSAEYDALPVGDPRREAASRLAADCWWQLCQSGHVAELLVEFRESVARGQLRQASHAIAAAMAGRAHGPSNAELARRRNPPDGDAARHVAHGLDPCPVPPCTGRGCPQPDPDGALRARYRWAGL